MPRNDEMSWGGWYLRYSRHLIIVTQRLITKAKFGSFIDRALE